jgi:hypothetical protein
MSIRDDVREMPVISVPYRAVATFGIFFCVLPLTFQLREPVPFLKDTSQREERLWNDH